MAAKKRKCVQKSAVSVKKEIEEVPDGWKYDGILFVDKKSALCVKEATEKDDTLPESLRNGDGKIRTLYDSEQETSFGLFLAIYLMKNKTSIAALARDVGVSTQSFFSWINGTSLPSPKNSVNLRKILGITPERFSQVLETNLLVHSCKITGLSLLDHRDKQDDMRKRFESERQELEKLTCGENSAEMLHSS